VDGYVSSLTTYPIKGCRGIDLTRVELGPAGLAQDRRYALVGADGVIVTQRTVPVLAAVRVTLTDAGLVLDAPGAGPLVVPSVGDGPRQRGDHFTYEFVGVDQGEVVADWFGAVTGVPCRLIRVPRDDRRRSNGLSGRPVGFADSAAVLVTSVSSLRGLNTRITEDGGTALPMDRFRANIVVDGWGEPHVEDRAAVLRVGDGELGYEKSAVRCSVTLIDQPTGTVAGKEPIRTLARYRRHPDGGVTFGVKFGVVRETVVEIGDKVSVLRELPDLG
jgi:uncharacterized protein YcbX